MVQSSLVTIFSFLAGQSFESFVSRSAGSEKFQLGRDALHPTKLDGAGGGAAWDGSGLATVGT